MADVQHDGQGAIRAAETLLRSTGGRSVLLRMPMAATGGDDAEQLGLASPQFNDIELAPCVFRKTGSRAALLVSAAVVLKVVESLAFDSADVLFRNAAGLVVDDVVLEIESAEPLESFGFAVCYRLELKPMVAW